MPWGKPKENIDENSKKPQRKLCESLQKILTVNDNEFLIVLWWI